MYCKICQREIEPVFKLRPDTRHYGEQRCPRCQTFLKWEPKPPEVKERNGARKKQPTNYSSDVLGIYHCQMCLRTKDMLGRNESLLVHHVLEQQDGGSDTPDNIWILCSHCHALTHHVRTYLYRHFVKGNPEVEVSDPSECPFDLEG